MTANPLSLGPWSGIDNRHKHTHPVFQLREEGATALTAAVNVLLNNDGWVEVRPGTTSRVTTTVGKNVFSALGLLLVQDGGDIKLIDPADWSESTVVTGLAADLRVNFIEQAGKIFYSNGTEHGIITAAGTAQNWGLIVPPAPTLGTTAGDLSAGRYRVSCLLVDATGAYSGAPEASTVEVDGTEDITVMLASADANTVSVQIYVSFTNAPDLYYVGQAAVGSLPVTITDVNVSSEILQTQFLVGPQALAGIDGIGSWRGFTLLWRGKRVIHSFGNAHHLFDVRSAVWKFPNTVRAVAGAEDVCWIATDCGMFTYQGIGAEGRKSDPIGRRAYAAGSITVDATEIPLLKGVKGRVAVFVSEDGIALGLPDGRLLHPQESYIQLDVVGKRATIVHHKADDKNQFFVHLE